MNQNFTSTQMSNRTQMSRDAQESKLPITCAIQRGVKTSNGAGGYTTVFTTVSGYEAVPCSLVMHSQKDQKLEDDKETFANQVTICLPYGTDIRKSTDQIVALGKTYTIDSIDHPVSVEILITVHASVIE